jgi:hypothetical protein
MRKALAFACPFVFCLVLGPAPSHAQEVVHALTGTVSAINTATKTVTVFQDNGSQGIFTSPPAHKLSLAFDKKVAAETTPAGAFDKKDSYVIVFYVGEGDARTAVAFKSLGQGPFASTVGTVEKFESHDHAITVQDKSGAEQTFKIDAGTVAEGGMGVEEGFKFHAEKGDQVRIVSSSAGGAPTALFVRSM